MPLWKKILLWGFSIGAGLAVVDTFIIGGAVWYSSRLSAPKQWNKAAIRATFDHLGVIADVPAFYYTLENLTDRDYSLTTNEGLRLLEMDDKGNLVLSDWRDSTTGDVTSISDLVVYDLPVFIPPGQKLHNYTIRVKLKVPDTEKQKPNETEESYRKRLAVWIDKFGFTGQWTLFDDRNRLQIEFPRGW